VSRNESRRRAPARVLTAAAVVAAILTTGALVFAGQEGYFEPPPRERWMVSFSLGATFPIGAFMHNLGQVGAACNLAIGLRIRDSPFMATFDFSGVLLDYHVHHDYLSATVPVLVEVETDNNICQGLFGIKYQPGTGRVRPYLEGLAGFSYFYTDTTVRGNDFPWNEITSQTDSDCLTFCGGAGAGVDFLFKGGGLSSQGTRRNAYRIDLKVRYLFGGRAKYLPSDAIVLENGGYTYSYRESATSMVCVQVGLVIDW